MQFDHGYRIMLEKSLSTVYFGYIDALLTAIHFCISVKLAYICNWGKILHVFCFILPFLKRKKQTKKISPLLVYFFLYTQWFGKKKNIIKSKTEKAQKNKKEYFKKSINYKHIE